MARTTSRSNCRLIGAAGATIAQVSPAEVCQRLNGSTEWYRGMGTQVFCRGGTAATTAAPTPRSFTINEDDIAKACQRVHGDPQATAEPITSGPSGLVLNCRMANHAGIPFVTPEDVCEAKFGTRGWMGVAGSKTFVCQAGPSDKPAQTAKTASAADGAPEAWNDVPLTEEAMLKGCRALHGPDATANPLTYAPRNAGVAGWYRAGDQLQHRRQDRGAQGCGGLPEAVGHARLVSDRLRPRHLDARQVPRGAARSRVPRTWPAAVPCGGRYGPLLREAGFPLRQPRHHGQHGDWPHGSPELLQQSRVDNPGLDGGRMPRSASRQHVRGARRPAFLSSGRPPGTPRCGGDDNDDATCVRRNTVFRLQAADGFRSNTTNGGSRSRTGALPHRSSTSAATKKAQRRAGDASARTGRRSPAQPPPGSRARRNCAPGWRRSSNPGRRSSRSGSAVALMTSAGRS